MDQYSGVAYSMNRLLALAALATLLFAVAGCGGSDSGSATFEQDGFGLTFEYPSGMGLADPDEITLAFGAGSEASEIAGLAYSDEDAIIVQRFDLTRKIGAGELDRAKAELDPLVRQLAPEAPEGKKGETNGLPSIEYSRVEVEEPKGGVSRLVSVFDGDAQYLFNCQSVKRGEEIAKACKQVLGSVESSP